MLYETQYIITYLASVGGIDASQTTGIIAQSVAGIDTTKPGIGILSYTNPLDESACEWFSYTSINGSQEFQGVVRAAEKGSAKIHGQNVAIAFPHSKSHNNQFADIFHPSALTSTAEDMMLKETASPPTTPSSGYKKIYHDTDGHSYFVGSDGTPNLVIDANEFFANMARQALINGNFDEWQRGTSHTTFTDSTITFLADRWFDQADDDGGTKPTLTRSRQALTVGDIPGSFYFSRLNTNGAGSSFGASAYHIYGQKIEYGTRFLCGNGKKVTVSFWAKSDIANKKLGIYLVQNYGTGGSPTSAEVLTGTNWTLTSTWTKYTYTFTTNTLAGKTFGTANDDNLDVRFIPMWGSGTSAGRVGSTGVAETYVGSGNIDITQVQLCAGDVALPFQPKSFGGEVQDSFRYAEVIPTGGIYPKTVLTANVIWFLVPTTVFKRTTPTLLNPSDGGAVSEGASNNLEVRNGANSAQTGFTFTLQYWGGAHAIIQASKTGHTLTDAVLVIGTKGILFSSDL